MKTKSRLQRKFPLIILITSLANIIILFLWIILYASPIIPKLNNIRSELSNKELKSTYTSIQEFNSEIKKLSKTYNVTFTLEDKSNNEIIKSKNKIDLLLLSKIITINDKDYLLEVYPNTKISITSIFLQLFIFEFILITIIFGIIFTFSRKALFKPIENIINDIRNYKIGKKPTKNKLTNELDLIQNEFVNLTQELEKEKKEQNRIIASISHDLKTPLTSIIGYSNLINDEKITKEEIKKYNEKIYSKAIHIKEIINTFDDYLVNNNTLSKTLISTNDIVTKLYNDYKVDLEDINIKFNIDNKASNKYVMVDLVKFKRVISNILSNSIRYISSDGVINIEISSVKKYIKFKISDNGPGVSEDIINRIFEPLFTTDTSRKISGLGLSICREFIELHGGSIKAYNRDGLTIEFTLPESN